MQVNTKVHEAMVARIRGDVRVPTRFVESMQAGCSLNPDPFTRAGRQPARRSSERLREQFRNESSTRRSPTGRRRPSSVDALAGTHVRGHVRTVAAVASQTDSWIST